MGSDEDNVFNEVAARDTSLLDADNVPNANQSLTCFSCDEPMTGLYCYACGNKNDNYRRSVWSLGAELFQSLTAFEGRIWRSLLTLILRPGRMARDFADGARQKWTSPIRMFLATSLLLFGYIALSGTQIIALGDIETGPDRSKVGLQYADGGVDYNQKLLFFVRKSKLKSPPEDRIAAIRQGQVGNFGVAQTAESRQDDIDAITKEIDAADAGIAKDALIAARAGLIADLEEIKANPNIMENNATSAGEDSEIAEGDEEDSALPSDFLQLRGLNGETVTLNSEGMSELYARILQNPEIINDQLNTKLKWAMFAMMPFAMFMGAIFIRGRETAMLFDHLVHAAYVHSFSFLLLFVFILLAQYTAIPLLILWYTIILLIYLPISARRAFQRSRFKAVLTAYGVGAVYTLTMLIIAVFIVAAALQTVALDISSHSPSSTIQPIP